MTVGSIIEQAESYADRIIRLRRAIHVEPELGLDTPKTLAKVKAELADLPLEWKEGPSTTGAIAILKGHQPGRSVLLRGDMDALPMQEHTGLDFASTIAGRMHACGHDTHTAMLAGAAHVLAGQLDQLVGEVRFMFQPGEEGFHGARYMIDDGLLDPLPDAAFALHIMPNARHGQIAGRTGPMLAAADQLDIEIFGEGGHASLPHQTLDPIPVAAEIISALQAMVTRQFDAAHAVVVTVTQLEAGTAHNIIADSARMAGTIRSLSARDRSKVHAAITRLAEQIAMAHGLRAKVKIETGFPVTHNDPRAVALGRALVSDIFSAEDWQELPHPLMGAEDFAYVLEKIPGAMFFLGVAEDGSDWSQCCGIHSSRMMVDERALPRGTAILAGCATQFLDRGWN